MTLVAALQAGLDRVGLGSRPAEADDTATLRDQLRHLETVLGNMPQGLCFFGADGRLVAANRRYAEIYHLQAEQVWPGITLREVVAARYVVGACPQMPQAEYLAWQEKIAVCDQPTDWVAELRNGRTVAVHHQPLPGGGYVSTHEDITHRSRNEAQMAFLARHDALTGLPNRLLFRERLNAALTHGDAGIGVAVLCLDLDRFKLVNDGLGHPIGDMLLRQVADRIAGCVREIDTVARIGGDEFAVIQAEADGPAAAAALAQRMIDVLSPPFLLDGHTVVSGTSIGICVAPRDGAGAGKLLRNADLALYEAKNDGRGVFRFFRPEMDAVLEARRVLERDLQRALAADEFELLYQPQVDLASGAVVGLEALVRWSHPTRGTIAPAEFIAVAEETGLVIPLGRWVVARACRDAAPWPGAPRVAVNLAAAQFRDATLGSCVFDALTASGLPAHRLELEITEALLLRSDAGTLELLREFRARGIHLAMDDFGAGTSSLAHLLTFPFSRVKIDRSFVGELAASRPAAAIVRAIAALARSLDMTTIAEGVETEEQLDLLREAGCTEAQGHLFSRAVPPDQVPGLLQRAGAMRAKPDPRPECSAEPPPGYGVERVGRTGVLPR